jgi:hypothetical protein
MDPNPLLSELQRRITDGLEADTDPARLTRLHWTSAGGLLHVDFYGSPFEEPFEELLAALATSEAASSLASLWLRGPDEGANGTRNWDLGPLVDNAPGFPALRDVLVEQTHPGDHNWTIVGTDYDEEGVLARFLAKAPALRSLTVPSAPSPEFFEVGPRPLTFLSVDSGYDHQNFIQGVSRSACFPELMSLEFGEYSDRSLPDWRDHCTPAEHYRELFASPRYAALRAFTWRDPAESDEKIRALKQLSPGVSLRVVRASSEYMR